MEGRAGSRSSLEQCMSAVADAGTRNAGLEAAVTDPHLALLDKVGRVRNDIKRQERALRDAKRNLEDVTEDVREENLPEAEARARLAEAEAEITTKRRSLQRCLREFRENLAEIARLSTSLFPEVPVLIRQRDQTSHLAELFTHEPEVARLMVVERKISHYSDRRPLSRTPDSRHDVDAAEFDGERVALKKYNLNRADSLKTLRQELAVLATLQHPNIIKVRLFFVEETSAAYVEFPLYERDMEDWLATGPSYPDVHAVVHDVLRAVEHMHRARIIHCDIRPKNVFMTRRDCALAVGVGQYTAVLADFDVSLNSSARATIWQTQTAGPRGFEGTCC